MGIIEFRKRVYRVSPLENQTGKAVKTLLTASTAAASARATIMAGETQMKYGFMFLCVLFLFFFMCGVFLELAGRAAMGHRKSPLQW